MARVVVNGYLVRYPLGGEVSNVLQWVLGLKRAGHDVYLFEQWGWHDSCFDPTRNTMSDDCSYGVSVMADTLGSHGLGSRWCYVDASGSYHGIDRARAEEICRTCDVFLDRVWDGAWLDEVSRGDGRRVLVELEPGWTQMRMISRQQAGETLPTYDDHVTCGLEVGSPACRVPTLGLEWITVNQVVCTEHTVPTATSAADAPFTTVMNWQSHAPLEFEGVSYGQKDREFPHFADLPRRVDVPLELAVAGDQTPRAELEAQGWRLRSAHEVTTSLESYRDYVASSRGEFAVAKHIFVSTRSGWFSDRSALYLANGRPVVLEDTGFGAHLPTGLGLMAVSSVEEAAAAIDEIGADYARHSDAARQIAVEYLDAARVLDRLLDRLGGS